MGNLLGALTEADPSAGPVHSALDASQRFGDLDTTRVDVGRLAPKILAFQQPIPVHEAKPVHIVRESHQCYVRVLVWDPFRDLLISGGGDGWIRLWSTDNFGLIGELDARLSVRSLLVLTQELVSGHSNGEVVIWAMERPDKPAVQTLQAHKEAVYALAMLSCGDLVTGAEDIRVFARSSGMLSSGFQLVTTVAEEVLCMCTVPKSTQVVTGDMNSLITVWDSGKQWQTVCTCRGHTRSVWAVCYVREADRCVSGSADQVIRVWDPRTWLCERELTDHRGWVVGLSSGPGWLLSCSIDQTVRVWDCDTWRCERTFDDQQYEVYSVCAFGGGRFATAGAEMSLVVYGGREYASPSKRPTVQDLPGARSTGNATLSRLQPVQPPEPQEDPNAGSWMSWLVGGASNGPSTPRSAPPASQPMMQSRNRTPPRAVPTTTAAPMHRWQQPSEQDLHERQMQRRPPATAPGFSTEVSTSESSSTARERRAQLMAQSSLDITMRDFRVGGPGGYSGAAHAHGAPQQPSSPGGRDASYPAATSSGGRSPRRAHFAPDVPSPSRQADRSPARAAAPSLPPPNIEDDPLGFDTVKCAPRVDVEKLRAAHAVDSEQVTDWSSKISQRKR